MRYGLLSGCLWGLDTVILGIALAMAPYLGSPETAVLASLAGAFLHDAFCAVWLFAYMGGKRRLKDTLAALKTRSGKAVAAAALLGGPLGMSGYVFAIGNIGAGYTAIISAFYPAFGSLMAVLFLKEKMSLKQVVALLAALAGVCVMGYAAAGSDAIGNPIIGVAGALVCLVGWGSEAVICAWGMRDDAVDNETALHIRQTTSGLTYLVVVAPVSGALGFAARAVPTPATGVIALAALAGTASYLFYYKAIGTIGASRGMALNISYSAWAVVFALVLLRTVPSPLQVGCCIVILTGTVLAATPDWRDLRPLRGRGRTDAGATSTTIEA